MMLGNMSSKYQIIDFPHFSDERGTLTPFELDESFPFEVKRVYAVTAADGAVRGGHAHKVESEIFVATSGSITAVVNDGCGDQTIELDAPNKALLVRPGCWHEFTNFSPNAVMLCFSSTHYFPGQENYITDKEAFLAQY